MQKKKINCNQSIIALFYDIIRFQYWLWVRKIAHGLENPGKLNLNSAFFQNPYPGFHEENNV